MKNAILYILPILLVTIVMTGCKKEGPDTPTGEIQGKWKLAEVGTDDSGNGIIVPKAVNPEQDDEYTFNSNGTGVEAYTGESNLSLTWEIIANDTLRVITLSNDTFTYYISLLNSSHMDLIENTSNGLVGQYFDKK